MKGGNQMNELPKYVREFLDDMLIELDVDTIELEYFALNGRRADTIKICGVIKDQDEYEHIEYHHWIDGMSHRIASNIYLEMQHKAIYDRGSKLYGTYYE